LQPKYVSLVTKTIFELKDYIIIVGDCDPQL